MSDERPAAPSTSPHAPSDVPPTEVLEDRHPVEELAEHYVATLRQGEVPRVDAWRQACPEHDAEISALFPTIAALERLRASREEEAGGSTGLALGRLERLGDFRLLRELGRGGMGIVYEAEQESLRRTVAVKVLPRSMLLDTRQVERFRREAQWAAGLHHTNIVPVFGVGEHEGYHYYVMQCIRGVSLDRVIREDAARPQLDRRLSPDRVARIGLQVAAALHYAHERDVRHGDIKPGNLIMDQDEAIWIADFGVAQALDRGQRAAGEVGGTCRYMSAEQYAGRADRRSDVFSLGVTLYELLALRPAYDEVGRRKELAAGQSTALQPLRGKVPVLPRDLEAIVFKAAALDPAQRYETAEALGRDLANYLDGRAVSARSAPLVERLCRWSSRNRLVATLSAATAALLIAVAVVASAGYYNVNQALQTVTQERSTAEANAGLATSALDKIFQRFSVSGTGVALDPAALDHSRIQPVLSAEAGALLQELVAYYEQLAVGAVSSPELTRKAAEAQRHVGDIYFQLGDYERAIDAYRDALRRHQVLVGAGSAVSDATSEAAALTMAGLHNAIGSALTLIDRRPDGQREHQAALAVLSEAELPASPAVQFAQARTYYLLGRRLRPGMGPYTMPSPSLLEDGPPEIGPRGRGEPPPGREPPPIRREGARGMGRPPGPPERLSPRRHFLAVRDDSPPSEEDLAYLRMAGEILQPLMEQSPDTAMYRLLWAACLREQASDYLSGRGPGDHLAEQTAFAELEKLVQDAPQSELFRYELLLAYAELSVSPLALAPPQYREAEVRLRRALDLAETLTSDNPNMPEYAAQCVQANFKLGVVLTRRARLESSDARRALGEEAERLYRRAIQKQTQLVKQHPHAAAYVPWLAVIQARLGALLRSMGQFDESHLWLTRALDNLQSAAEQPDVAARLDGLFAAVHISLAHTYDILGKPELAEAARDEARRWSPDGELPLSPPGGPLPPAGPPPFRARPERSSRPPSTDPVPSSIREG